MFLEVVYCTRTRYATVAGDNTCNGENTNRAQRSLLVKNTNKGEKDTNVIMTALEPGVTDTDFFNKADAQDSKLVHPLSTGQSHRQYGRKCHPLPCYLK